MPLGNILFLRTYLWWSLCNLYLLAGQVRVTVDDSGVCCVCARSLERCLTPLFADPALWASFCFRLLLLTTFSRTTEMKRRSKRTERQRRKPEEEEEGGTGTRRTRTRRPKKREQES